MKTVLDVAAAWAALDVVLLGAWHFAHVRARRPGARAVVPATAAATGRRPEAPLGRPRLAVVRSA